eukprot:CAMPEP_0118943488 /NCGR_PEP_ID=MMETSP1169-20130426/38419_1 /TAXON_ID=36882 /ORGANISM="Pyramimonas obovata, Strain CCMP722" /LENGTH=106 /DNA_ID=CAMNT_0006888755 /DNA_START=15 /DNA_END=335 /DNA_ORIENTATION=-
MAAAGGASPLSPDLVVGSPTIPPTSVLCGSAVCSRRNSCSTSTKLGSDSKMVATDRPSAFPEERKSDRHVSAGRSGSEGFVSENGLIFTPGNEATITETDSPFHAC